MKIIVDENDKHIQINDLYVENLESFLSFWRDLQNKYAGYEIDFCYHNCEVPIEFMHDIGMTLLESCVETRLVQKNFAPVYMDCIEPTLVTLENFAAFSILHDKTNPEMFWTSEKISKDLSRWRIYMYGDSYAMMSLWGDVSEIFALETLNSNESVGAVLLSEACKFAFETGKTGVLIMIDDDSPVQVKTAKSVGFIECGKYAAYRGIIK